MEVRSRGAQKRHSSTLTPGNFISIVVWHKVPELWCRFPQQLSLDDNPEHTIQQHICEILLTDTDVLHLGLFSLRFCRCRPWEHVVTFSFLNVKLLTSTS